MLGSGRKAGFLFLRRIYAFVRNAVAWRVPLEIFPTSLQKTELYHLDIAPVKKNI